MCCRASLVAQMVKNLPAVQETWVQSLGWEDPQEKGMATHSNILARRIPWTEEPGKLQSMGLQRVRHDWATNIFISWMCCSTMSRNVSGSKTIPCAQHFQPGNHTGVDCYFLLLGIFPTQGLKLGLLHCRQTLYRLTHQGSPVIYNINCILFFLATLCDLWDLSSLTRDWTWVLAVEVPSPNHWTAREFPTICFLIEPSKWCY